jgi:hypothetical protein
LTKMKLSLVDVVTIIIRIKEFPRIWWYWNKLQL